MAALYALARRIDDIGDGDDEPASKVRQLDAVRADLRTLRSDAGRVGDPVFAALAHAATRFPIPLDAFDDLIDGCERDSTSDVQDGRRARRLLPPRRRIGGAAVARRLRRR